MKNYKEYNLKQTEKRVNMDYYKILNENENETQDYRTQYITGLNEINCENFDPDNEGILFARENILAFIDDGPWLQKVMIPEDAKVYESSDEKITYWKANKIILGERKRINAEIIKKLINEGADPKVDNSFALQWASRKGYLEIVRVLLEAGANPKANNSHALHQAVVNNHLEIVRALLEHGADPKAENSYALRCAAEKGYLEITKLLISKSEINSVVIEYINKRCKVQEIRNLIFAQSNQEGYMNKHPQEVKTFKNNYNSFINWLNKFVSVLIIFILIGCGLGFYLSKIVYDLRLKEITQVGGFVFEKQIYDVNLRP
jgi:ankyrin repeat protein